MGKHCSVPECGWKPLTEYNFSSKKWDNLRTTCKICLAKKRKKNHSSLPQLSISQESICYRLNQNIRGRILISIQNNKEFIKNQNMLIHYLGCTIDEFKRHIETTFTEGMSWDKYGYYIDNNGVKQIGFHIDHIIPCCAFDLHDPWEMLLCFHWKNCRAMWGRDNMSKGGRYNIIDKLNYIQSQQNIIHRDKADELVKIIIQQVEEEKKTINTAIAEERTRIHKQAQLYQDYLHDQCLEAVQLMFFAYENRIHDKSYKASIVALMKNKESRKSGSDNPRSKRVCKFSMHGELIGIYESMNIAAQQNNTFHASISKCCSNPEKLFSCGGFRWCFEENMMSVVQRCRFIRVMAQLLKTKPCYDIYCKLPIPSRSDETREKIGSTMKKFFSTDEGRESKRKAFAKRSETMKARREQMKITITEKECRSCHQTLPLASFSKKSASVDGVQSYCKPCALEKKK